jgi:hypothetical protein
LTEEFREKFLDCIDEIREVFLKSVEKDGFARGRNIFSTEIRGDAFCDNCGANTGMNIINFQVGVGVIEE